MRFVALLLAAVGALAQSSAEWTEKANEFYRSGRYQQAIEACDEALKQQPDFAAAFYRRGLALAQLQKYDAALNDYNRKIQIEPTATNGYLARANVLWNLKRYRESLADADRGIALDAANANLQIARGLALRELKRLDEAERAFVRALDLNPNSVPALTNLGLMKVGLNDRTAAIRFYDRALAIDGNNATALLNRSSARLALQEYGAAIRDVDLILASNPGDADARTNRDIAVRGLARAGAPPVLQFNATDPCAAAPGAAVPWTTGLASAPPAVPAPALPAPLVDMTKISAAQFNGAVSTAMEGMRLLYGPMPAEDVRAFEAAWTPLFDNPTNKSLDYLNRLIPLLGQFLSGREAWFRAASALELATLESALAVAADARNGWNAAMAEADRQALTLAELDTGLAQLAAAIRQLGNPPNPLEAKCGARKRFREAVARLDPAPAQSGLAGIWERWMECTGENPQDPDVNTALDQLDRSRLPWNGVGRVDMLLLFTSAESLHSSGLVSISPTKCPLTQKRHSLPFIESGFARSDTAVPFQGWNPDPRAPIALRGSDEAIIASSSPAGCRQVARRIAGTMPDPPPGWRAEDLASLRQVLPAELARIGPTLRQELRQEIPGRQKTLQDVAECRAEYLQVRQVFFEEAVKYLGSTDPRARKAADSEKFAGVMESRLRSLGPAAPSATSPSAQASPPQGKAAEDAAQETIAFHESMVELLKRNLAREQQDLARETDEKRRKEFAFRALQLESDLQAEQDLVASYKSGKLVHTRTAFDEYANQQFVRKTAEEAARVDLTRKIAAGIERQIDLLPAAQQPAARAQARSLVDARTVATGDVDKARRLASALDKQVQGYWQGESARQEEKAIAAEEREFYAQMTVMASGTVLAGLGQAALAGTFGEAAALTVWSPHLIGGIYGGATGLIAGGPAEGIAGAVANSSALGGVAVQFLQGYRQAAAQPGAKLEDALWSGAMQAGTGWLVGKAIQFGSSLTARGALSFFGKESRLFQPLTAPRVNWQQNLNAVRLQEAVKEGETMLGRFQQAQTNLARARAQSPAGSAEVAALEKEARQLAGSINASYHGKWLMKYKGHPSLRRGFNALVEESYRDMMPEMVRRLRSQGYDMDNIEFRSLRNSSSAGTSSMDLDLALKERPGMVITRNGQPASLQQFQRDAQRAMNQAYNGVTGYSAVRSELNLTTSVHEEAFSNLKLLKHNVDFTAISPEDVAQIGKVLGVKLDKIAGDPVMAPLAKVQASCREASKEIGNMLLPNLRQRAAQAPAGSPQAQQLQADLAYWEEIGRRMREIGTQENNPYRILEMDRELRRDTGGLGAIEIVRELTRFFGKIAG